MLRERISDITKITSRATDVVLSVFARRKQAARTFASERSGCGYAFG
jgi:hypothetical protein